jgi:predicted transcriptional regulator
MIEALLPRQLPNTQETILLSTSEQAVLDVFREFRVSTGEMLCFQTLIIDKHRASLKQMIEKGLLVKENHKGSYSLTDAGFAAMKNGNN